MSPTADRCGHPVPPRPVSDAARRPAGAQQQAVPMQVVILAAGMGTRLGRPLPKPLTTLRDGRSILRHQLDALRAAFGETTEITLVVGHMAEHLVRAAPGAAFVHNPDYARTNTSKSLLRALRQSRADAGVLWLNGDVVFDPAILQHLVPMVRAGQSFVCVDTASVGDEEVKYTVDTAGFIRELSKTVTDGLGEAIGINFVSAADKQLLIEHLERCDDSDYFERAIETAVAQHDMRACPVDISAFAAVEVDFEEDLVRANLLCLPRVGEGSHRADPGPPAVPAPRSAYPQTRPRARREGS